MPECVGVHVCMYDYHITVSVKALARVCVYDYHIAATPFKLLFFCFFVFLIYTAEAYSQAIERKLKAGGGNGTDSSTTIVDSLEKEKQDLAAQLQKQRADLAGMLTQAT